jgi:hypothetical protein
MLNEPSNEQLTIIESLQHNNIIVDAVAGSGKTTTILHIAKRYPDLKILLLTYNAKLKLESRNKAQTLGLTNIEIHSYHAFCVKYYDKACFTDAKIIKILKRNHNNHNNHKEKHTIFNYNIIIVDEAQDMNNIYFELVYKILHGHEVSPKVCLLGDRNQCIFEFNNADNRYLTRADSLFNVNDNQWITYNLSTSFRITKQMANFINKSILKSNRLVATKEGPLVNYIICDTFMIGSKMKYAPYLQIKKYLTKYNYDDIFILAPSIKSSKTPVRLLANILTNDGVPIYVPISDEEKLDEEIVNGKIVFSTFHQVKGLERKVVIVFNFSDSYFDYYKKNADPTMCPDEIYVAITRAQEEMTIFHHFHDEFFRFIDIKELRSNTNFIINERLTHNNLRNKISQSKEKDKRDLKPIGVTEIIKHISSTAIEHAVNMLNITHLRDPGPFINIESKTKQTIDLSENVSDINGTAIPAYYELNKNNHISLLTNLNTLIKEQNSHKEYDFDNGVIVLNKKYALNDVNNVNDMNDANDVKDANDVNDDTPKLTQVEKILKLSNYYCSYISGYNFKLNQIQTYDWITEDIFNSCVDRLDQLLGIDSINKFEIMVEYKEDPILANNGKFLRGFIDCIQGKNVYEFKCVNHIQHEHILQLAIYGFLHKYMLDNIFIDKVTELNKQIHTFKRKQNVVFYSLNNNKWYHGFITNIYKGGYMTINADNIIYTKIQNSLVHTLEWFEEYNNIKLICKNTKYNYYLYNILNDELIKIDTDYDAFKNILEYLVRIKYEIKNKITDDVFIDNCNQIKTNYILDDILDMNNIENVPEKQHIMVLDIETNGKTTIVEIAYNIYDINMNLIKKTDLFLNDGSGTRDYYKKIKLEQIISLGLKPIDALKQLASDLAICKYIVCHNINFDMKHISSYMYKFNINCHYPIELDTMVIGKNIVKTTNKKGNIKNPKLEELYKFLFNKQPNLTKCHLGSYDVKMTAKCLKKMIDDGLYAIPN